MATMRSRPASKRASVRRGNGESSDGTTISASNSSLSSSTAAASANSTIPPYATNVTSGVALPRTRVGNSAAAWSSGEGSKTR